MFVAIVIFVIIIVAIVILVIVVIVVKIIINQYKQSYTSNESRLLLTGWENKRNHPQ